MLSQDDTTPVANSDNYENDKNLTNSQDDFQNAAVAAYFDYLYMLATKPAPERPLRLKKVCKKQKHRGRKSDNSTDLSFVYEPSELSISGCGQHDPNNSPLCDQQKSNDFPCEISQSAVNEMCIGASINDAHAEVSSGTSEAVAAVNSPKPVPVLKDTSNTALNTPKHSSDTLASLSTSKPITSKKDTSNTQTVPNTSKLVAARKNNSHPDPHLYTSKLVATGSTPNTSTCSNTPKAVVDGAADSNQRTNVHKTGSYVYTDKTPVYHAADLGQRIEVHKKTVLSTRSGSTAPVHISVSDDACDSADIRNLTFKNVTMSPRTKKHNENLVTQIFNSLYDSLIDQDAGDNIDESFDLICDESFGGGQIVKKLKKPRRKLKKLSDCLFISFNAGSRGSSVCGVSEGGSADMSANVEDAISSDTSFVSFQHTIESSNQITHLSARKDETFNINNNQNLHDLNKQHANKNVGMSQEVSSARENEPLKINSKKEVERAEEISSVRKDERLHIRRSLKLKKSNRQQINKKIEKSNKVLSVKENESFRSRSNFKCHNPNEERDKREVENSQEVPSTKDDEPLSIRRNLKLQNSDKQQVKQKTEKSRAVMGETSSCEECLKASVHKVKHALVVVDQSLIPEPVINLNSYNGKTGKICSEYTARARSELVSCTNCSGILSSGDKRKYSHDSVMLEDKADCSKGDNSVISDSRGDNSIGSGSKGDDSVVSHAKGNNSAVSDTRRDNLFLPDLKGDNIQIPNSREDSERKEAVCSWLDDDADSTCSGVAGSSDTETFDVSKLFNRRIKLRSGTKVSTVIDSKCQKYYKLVSKLSKQSEKSSKEGKKEQSCARFKRKRRLDWSERKPTKRRKHSQINHGDGQDTLFFKVKSWKSDLIKNSMKFARESDNWKRMKHKAKGRKKNFENVAKRFENISKQNLKAIMKKMAKSHKKMGNSKRVKNCKEANVSKNHRRKMKVDSSKISSLEREMFVEEQSILKYHEAQGTNPVPMDPFSHLCQLERKAINIGVDDMENLLPSTQADGRNSTVVFSGQHKLIQWHPGGIWQAIVTEK